MRPKGASSMAMSDRKALVGTGRVISIVFDMHGLRNKPSCLEEPPFPAFIGRFQLRQVGISQET